MNLFILILSLFLPLTSGFLFVSLFWRKDRSVFADLPLRCCLAVGFGFGISSCLVFVWMILVGRLSRGVFVCESILLVVLCGLLTFRTKRGISAITAGSAEIPTSYLGPPYLLRMAVCIASVSGVILFVYLVLHDPHGKFDAYAIWDLRARFLYRGGNYWENYIYMTWSHPDYPLLIPASIARIWEFIGRESQIIPCTIAFLFTFSTIGTVSISIARFRGERQGILAALILLGTPFLIIHGASLYADIPLGFFFVASVALLFLHLESPSHKGLLTLAGMAAGFSAWTKNEGILFGILFCALYFMVTINVEGRKCWDRRGAGAFLLGVMPLIAIIAIYKVCLAGTSDVIAALELRSTASRLVDMARYQLVMNQFVRGLFTFGGWSYVLPMPLFLLFHFLLLGGSVEEKDAAAIIIGTALLTLTVGGYLFIYIVSPWDLLQYMDLSLNRLLIQVWPLFVFVYFAIVRSPEQAVIAARLALTRIN
jgi:hypothetical protein